MQTALARADRGARRAARSAGPRRTCRRDPAARPRSRARRNERRTLPSASIVRRPVPSASLGTTERGESHPVPSGLNRESSGDPATVALPGLVPARPRSASIRACCHCVWARSDGESRVDARGQSLPGSRAVIPPPGCALHEDHPRSDVPRGSMPSGGSSAASSPSCSPTAQMPPSIRRPGSGAI